MNIVIMAKKIDELMKVCKLLRQILINFETIVTKENDAIRRSDINELEVITTEKIAFGSAIENQSQKVRCLMDEIKAMTAISKQREQPVLLNELTSYLQNWAKAESGGQLNENINRLAEVVQSLADERLKIFPKLEANSYLVKKLLQYHQETCLFWQEFANESEAVYGKTGRISPSAQRAILTVRT